jgi:hypothetical protein
MRDQDISDRAAIPELIVRSIIRIVGEEAETAVEQSSSLLALPEIIASSFS